MDEEEKDLEGGFPMHDDMDDDLLDVPEDLDFGSDDEDPDKDH